jgi:ABC-2 type transport system permease protein
VNRRRVAAVVGKEWAEAVRNRTIVWTYAVVALVLLAMPLVLAFVLIDGVAADLRSDPASEEVLRLLEGRRPALAALADRERMQVLLLRQMVPLYLILPVLGAMSIATFSVVGEKTSRSLEPLLVTPLTAGELLFSKTLAAAVPAVAGAWLTFGAFVAATLGLGGTRVAAMVADGAAWLTILLIGPLIALLGIGAGVLVSARAKDPRSAQQIGSLVLLPLIVLVAAPTKAAFLLSPLWVLAGAALLAVLVTLLFRWGVRLFDRERIFTHWR